MYRLRSVWKLDESPERLWTIALSALGWPDPLPWWPAMRILDHRGDELDLEARSGLGYRLRFTVHTIDVSTHRTLRFRARGDVEGGGVIDFRSGQSGTELVIDWRVRPAAPWMRRLDWLLRPLFVVGHRRVMHAGESRLRRWLDSPG